MNEGLGRVTTVCVGCGVVIFVFAASLSILYGAGMCPSDGPVRVFFPFGVLIGWSSPLRLGTALAVNALQWPLYGLIVALADAGGPRASMAGKWALALAVVAHLGAFVLALP